MAKKKRSAKQLANDRKLGARARARGKGKSRKRTSTARKPNKQRKRTNHVAKKKPVRRRAVIGGQLKKGGMGAVGGIATKVIVDRLGARSISDDLSYIVASQVGGKAGVIGNAVARQTLQRFGGSLSGLIPNGNGGGNGTNGGFGFA